MKIRIRLENGVWKTYFVYSFAHDDEFEVFMDQYSSLVEAHSVAMYVAGDSL